MELNREEKERIYGLLRQLYQTEQDYPMAAVAADLINEGVRAADYGFKKAKPLFEALPEFFTIRESFEEGVARPPWMTFHEWGEAPAGTGEPPRPFKRPEYEAVDAEVREGIYQSLAAAFPFEEPQHLAAVSLCLNEAGYTKDRFGYGKMKLFLQEAGAGMLSFEEQLMGGVPQSLVTLHRMPEWDAGLPAPVSPAVQPQAEDRFFLLPKDLWKEVFLAPKTLQKLNACVAGTEAQPSKELLQTLTRDYEAAREAGNFHFKHDAYVFPLSLKDREGEPLAAAIKRSDHEGGASWYLNYAGLDHFRSGKNPGRLLEQFAFLGTWQTFLDSLAGKALKESWDFEGSTRKNKFILQKYIQYTFYRLQLEDKICISDGGQFAAFNTGLVTPHYDDLYACFEPSYGDSDIPWRFLDFCTAAGRGVGKRLVDCFNPLPQPPSYFSRKEDLLYDLEKELHCDFEHILLDNISRLPLDFIREECHNFPDVLERLEELEADTNWMLQKSHYQELADLIGETPRIFNRLRNRLEDAIELAKKQVRWNFKTAIPCFFPTRNVMSLMLPLSLREDGNADAALVVELTRSGNYQGQTILTLQQAYLDGRLLCRPNSEWLDTKSIQEDDPKDPSEP